MGAGSEKASTAILSIGEAFNTHKNGHSLVFYQLASKIRKLYQNLLKFGGGFREKPNHFQLIFVKGSLRSYAWIEQENIKSDLHKKYIYSSLSVNNMYSFEMRIN